MNNHLPLSLLTFSLLATSLFVSCGEDRSGEQPFPPTVESLSAEVVSDSVLLTGHVSASPNSTLLECGYEYGNDTLRLKSAALVPTDTFTVSTRPLLPGHYYAVSYARNGVGTSHGDTLWFEMK